MEHIDINKAPKGTLQEYARKLKDKVDGLEAQLAKERAAREMDEAGFREDEARLSGECYALKYALDKVTDTLGIAARNRGGR